MYLNISRKINTLDNYVLFIINKYLKNKYLDILMPLITIMGNLGIIWVIIAIVLSLNSPYKTTVNLVILTLIISTTIGEGIIKHIVKRVRPCNIVCNNMVLITKPLSYSFPSGHTLSSFAVAKVLSIYFHEYELLFMVIAILIALSRLYLYVHYPTDVLAGIILGLLCSKIVLIIIGKGYLGQIIFLYQHIK
jgi:undecaprenyl-diphosphatase